VRALIPGYVFARFDPNKRLPILTVPGVAYVIGTRSGPAPVDIEELEAIRRIADSSSAAEPWPYVAVGQTVMLEDGPLRGLRGKLVSVSSHLKVIVSITLLQRSVSVEVDRRWVRRSDEHEWVPSPGAIY
jgi:transcription antitermination factor NusG